MAHSCYYTYYTFGHTVYAIIHMKQSVLSSKQSCRIETRTWTSLTQRAFKQGFELKTLWFKFNLLFITLHWLFIALPWCFSVCIIDRGVLALICIEHTSGWSESGIQGKDRKLWHCLLPMTPICLTLTCHAWYLAAMEQKGSIGKWWGLYLKQPYCPGMILTPVLFLSHIYYLEKAYQGQILKVMIGLASIPQHSWIILATTFYILFLVSQVP